MDLYLTADETDWCVSEIGTSDGTAEGHWITYPGPVLGTLVGEPVYEDVHIVCDSGLVRGELEFDGLLLWPRFHIDFGDLTRQRVRGG